MDESDKKTLSERIAENLQALMLIKQMTQQQVAAKSGLGQTTVSLYLRPGARRAGKTGKVPGPQMEQVQRLAGALDLEAWELLMPREIHEQFVTYQRLAMQIKAQPPQAGERPRTEAVQTLLPSENVTPLPERKPRTARRVTSVEGMRIGVLGRDVGQAGDIKEPNARKK